MILNRSSSRIVIVIRSVAAIAAAGAGKSAAGQLMRPENATFLNGWNTTFLKSYYIAPDDNSRYVKSKTDTSNPTPPTSPQPRAAQNAARAPHHLTIKPPSPSPTS
ncbi:hypothetical protein KDX01_01795 [Burkholderia vietnamiensis]|uniref:hypothetical protein n=1 Tax=Burkholderia vietnamiensis TaxID=60552 RepID=UPI001B91EE0E|nr:hypothetical protein [Burkholderia vietnamiensis]MBR7971848.1 hypothetical protein [Burkholderia vietnamiensis]